MMLNWHFVIFVLIFLEIFFIGKLGKYKTDKFSGSSLNCFTKAKNLVFLIPKNFYRTFLSTLLDIVPLGF